MHTPACPAATAFKRTITEAPGSTVLPMNTVKIVEQVHEYNQGKPQLQLLFRFCSIPFRKIYPTMATWST